MIFLTGATGFIGSHFIEKTAAHEKIRCLVRPESISKIKKYPNLEVVSGDLLNRQDLEEFLEGVDCVVHLAALLRNADSRLMHRVNVEGAWRIVESAKRRRVRRLVFLSTENTLRGDLDDPYARTKRQAEDIVRTFENSIILRASMVYGPGDSHGLGRLLNLAEHSPIVPLFGQLRAEVQPVYIEDVVEYLQRSVQNDLRGDYLVAGPDKISLNALIKKMCDLRGIRGLRIPIPYLLLTLASTGARRDQLKNIYGGKTYSIEKTVKDFNYRPLSLDEGLRKWLSLPPSGGPVPADEGL